MEMNRNTQYEHLVLPEDLLTSFAKAMAPEIKKFYESLQRQKMSTATVTPNPVDTDSSTETV